MKDSIANHREKTRELALSLDKNCIYNWLLTSGYFPESYVLPPCFSVYKTPKKPKSYFDLKSKKRIDPVQCSFVHFPKSEYTDRTFGIIHPHFHNDIAYLISQNWTDFVEAMIPSSSKIASYSFPLPVNARKKGRIGHLRSGRMIYEFITMTDDDLASISYKYNYIVRTDIKNFYPSIYTHSLAWAIHGKNKAREPSNRHNYNLLGNQLDRLFQLSNDGQTNGIPIGPVVSDIAAEVIASAVDSSLTSVLDRKKLDYAATRFRDDYRILVQSEEDGRTVIKALQFALKEFNLELNDEKTSVQSLPNGLFREWVSRYHLAYPKKTKHFSWKEFRELYIEVISIEKKHPGTGLIDRFLADINDKKGKLKIELKKNNLEKTISMLVMLASFRTKSFPKILSIIEQLLKSPQGEKYKTEIINYVENLLKKLIDDEPKNLYLIIWVSYFIVSNDLKKHMKLRPRLSNVITKSVYRNTGAIFNKHRDFKIFVNLDKCSKKVSMFEHLEVFRSRTQ